MQVIVERLLERSLKVKEESQDVEETVKREESRLERSLKVKENLKVEERSLLNFIF